MKKVVIKVIVLIACLLMPILKPQEAGAQNDVVQSNKLEQCCFEGLEEMLSHIAANPDLYHTTIEGRLRIMSPVAINVPERSTEYTITHLPIVDDTNRVILIYTIINTDNGVSTSIGPAFSLLLNCAIENECKTVCLLQSQYSFYAITEKAVYLQTGQTIQKLNGVDSLPKEIFALYDSGECNYTTLQIDKSLSVLTSGISNKDVSVDSTFSSTRSGSGYLPNYPIVGQKIGNVQYSMCWAAVVASMVRYEKPTIYGSLTAKNVCDYMNIGYNDGGLLIDVKNALSHYLGGNYVPTIYQSVLSQSQIQTVIDNNDPAYMETKKIYEITLQRHGVALISYNFTGSNTYVGIMDPAYETYSLSTYNQGNGWTFPFGNDVYKWTRTVRLLYSN